MRQLTPGIHAIWLELQNLPKERDGSRKLGL